MQKKYTIVHYSYFKLTEKEGMLDAEIYGTKINLDVQIANCMRDVLRQLAVTGFFPLENFHDPIGRVIYT